MRLLVITPHFYRPHADSSLVFFCSQIEPLARIAAFNAMVVALHRHFGPRRHGLDPNTRLPDDRTPKRVLDLVVLQIPGCGLLEHVGIDPSCYELELFAGPSEMLIFEAQRVLRDRVGNYDYYAVIEDDMIIHDPLFFDKLAWFECNFGTEALLKPTRYEMAQSGLPAMVVNEPDISENLLSPLRRPNQPRHLSARWAGHEQSFVIPRNPHAGGYFVSDSQLRHWLKMPWFYDRDPSWVGPLESATNLSIGRTFNVYKPSSPDPFFLSIEHYGTRYARATAPPGKTYGDTPLLELAYRALRGENDGILSSTASGLNALMQRQDALVTELGSLKRSRSKLLVALCAAIFEKFGQGIGLGRRTRRQTKN